MDSLLYSTDLGKYYIGKSEEILTSSIGKGLKNKVQLIITSPPFPLNKKKRYGNLQGEEYKNWFVGFAEMFSQLLTDDGSIVLELGNSKVKCQSVNLLDV
ncbi:MAG: DNA methyltransferase [Clostridiaceae bacterium]|nr:DNA methyltransferase [Clostridiaceae bacterium]